MSSRTPFPRVQPRGFPRTPPSKLSGLRSAGPNCPEELGKLEKRPQARRPPLPGIKATQAGSDLGDRVGALTRALTFCRGARSLFSLLLSGPLDLRTSRLGKRISRAAALSPSSGIFLRIPTSWPRSLWGFPSSQPRVLASSSAPALLAGRPGIHGRAPTAEAGVALPFGAAGLSRRVVSRPPATSLIWYEKRGLGGTSP